MQRMWCCEGLHFLGALRFSMHMAFQTRVCVCVDTTMQCSDCWHATATRQFTVVCLAMLVSACCQHLSDRVQKLHCSRTATLAQSGCAGRRQRRRSASWGGRGTPCSHCACSTPTARRSSRRRHLWRSRASLGSWRCSSSSCCGRCAFECWRSCRSDTPPASGDTAAGRPGGQAHGGRSAPHTGS